MKKILSIVFITSFILLVGCSDTSPTEEKKVTQKTTEEATSGSADKDLEEDLEEDFIEYLDSIGKLAPEEERLIGLYDGVTGNNYINDEELYNTISVEIISGYISFINDVEEIKVKNQEIRDIHEKYIEGINIQGRAFTLILSAIEKQDYDIITEANEKLDEARGAMRDYSYDLEELADRLGVSLQ